MNLFTTVPGVREDVTDIILNLRGLVCRLIGEADEIEVELNRQGPGVVTTGDILLLDRNCHQSHHYGMMLGGANVVYLDAYPLNLGSEPIGHLRQPARQGER